MASEQSQEMQYLQTPDLFMDEAPLSQQFFNNWSAVPSADIDRWNIDTANEERDAYEAAHRPVWARDVVRGLNYDHDDNTTAPMEIVVPDDDDDELTAINSDHENATADPQVG